MCLLLHVSFIALLLSICNDLCVHEYEHARYGGGLCSSFLCSAAVHFALPAGSCNTAVCPLRVMASMQEEEEQQQQQPHRKSIVDIFV